MTQSPGSWGKRQQQAGIWAHWLYKAKSQAFTASRRRSCAAADAPILSREDRGDYYRGTLLLPPPRLSPFGSNRLPRISPSRAHGRYATTTTGRSPWSRASCRSTRIDTNRRLVWARPVRPRTMVEESTSSRQVRRSVIRASTISEPPIGGSEHLSSPAGNRHRALTDLGATSRRLCERPASSPHLDRRTP